MSALVSRMWKHVNAYSLLGLMLLPCSGLEAREFDWMPPEATDKNSRGVDLGYAGKVPEVVYTTLPKETAKKQLYKTKYTLELKKFSISNKGINPVETSKGINAALQHAKTIKANYIVFPKGTYLISEHEPVVLDHQNTIIDLNGATLQINTNGLKKYAVVQIVNPAHKLRLTNGIIRGDKDTHDYKTVKSSHEWGQGIEFAGGTELEVDHLTLTNMTGDGAASETSGAKNRAELLASIKYSIYPKDLESGGFDETGEKMAQPTTLRTVKPLATAKCQDGKFELGYLAGYMGFPFIKARQYQVYFYDASGSLIEKQDCYQYRKVYIPEKATAMHLEFNQGSLAEEPAHFGARKGSWVVRINDFKPSTDVHFHHNTLLNNRRLGFAFCGGQRWIIENNIFDGNKGTAPAYGFDFEDGWELMQDIVVRKNVFRNNGGDLVAVAGSEIVIEDNVFEKTVSMSGRTTNYHVKNNTFKNNNVSFTTRTGVATIEGNKYHNVNLKIHFDRKAVADGLVRKDGETVSTPPLTLNKEKFIGLRRVTGTYFKITNSIIQDAKFVVGKDTSLVHFEKNRLKDVEVFYESGGPKVHVALKRNSGMVSEEGPGLKRKVRKL